MEKYMNEQKIEVEQKNDSLEINPFIKLSKWARRQGENYTTELFVFILERLKSTNSPLFARLMKDICKDLFPEKEMENIKLYPQTCYEEISRKIQPDITLCCGTLKTAYIEIKINGGTLQLGQLSGYRDKLLKEKLSKTGLFTISTRKLTYPDVLPDNSVLWKDITCRLKESIKSDPANDILTQYLINMFIEYLEDQGISPRQIKPGNHFAKLIHIFNNYESYFPNQIRTKQARSACAILGTNGMEGIRQLFNRIIECMEQCKIKPYMLVCGKDGWIGYSIQKMKYFITVNIHEPDILIFSSHNCPLVEVQTGKISGNPSKHTWKNNFLLDDTFYSKHEDEQYSLISQFIKHSYEFAERLGKKH